jgi:hypothetical protein
LPYKSEYVAPELFVEHNGVKIYRTYKDDDIDEPRPFWYTADVEMIDPSDEFDVRQLPVKLGNLDTSSEEGRRAIIRAAIDAGHFDDGQPREFALVIDGEYGVNEGSISLFRDGQEVVMWDSSEWIDDPSLVYVIANAINRRGIPEEGM